MLESFGPIVFPGIVVNSRVCVFFTSSKLVDCKIGTWLVKGWGGFWFVVCLCWGAVTTLRSHSRPTAARPGVTCYGSPPQPPQLYPTFAISDPPPAGDHDLLKMRLSEGLIVCLREPSVAFWNEVSGISCDRSGRPSAPGGSWDSGSRPRAAPSRAATHRPPRGVACGALLPEPF